MSVITVDGFLGENRAIHPKLLNEKVGTTSNNQKPGRGDLRPWKAPATVSTVPSGRNTIYRMGRDVASDASYWLAWPAVVHAMRGFETDDATERTYYTGDGAPKVTDNTIALSGGVYPAASRPLGVPAPTIAPAVTGTNPAPETETITKNVNTVQIADGICQVSTTTPNGFEAGNSVVISLSNGFNGTYTIQSTVSADTFMFPASGTVGLTTITGTAVVTRTKAVTSITESYFYVFTWVNDWGWESAPSPPSLEVVRDVGGTTRIFDFETAPGGGYNINRRRIYRTQAGSNGTADFYFLGEIGIGDTELIEDGQDLGEVCPTVTWLMPPSDLSFLTSMWNGMAAGISNGVVRVSEAYQTYAWPIAYDVVPPDAKAVGLGVFGQNLLVITNGRPVLVTGSSPDGLDQQPLEIPQACISPRSIVSMGFGVAWASNDGLMFYGSGGAKMLTAGVMLRDDWLALNPQTIIGQMYDGLYYGSYEVTVGGARKGFIINPADPQGIYFTDYGFTAAHFDKTQDQLYVLFGSNVQRWDSGAYMTVGYKSKVFQLSKPTQCFACAQVLADTYPVTFKLYSDGVLKHTETVADNNPFRLPSGYYSQNVQIELSGGYPIQVASIAHSMDEISKA